MAKERITTWLKGTHWICIVPHCLLARMLLLPHHPLLILCLLSPFLIKHNLNSVRRKVIRIFGGYPSWPLQRIECGSLFLISLPTTCKPINPKLAVVINDLGLVEQAVPDGNNVLVRAESLRNFQDAAMNLVRSDGCYKMCSQEGGLATQGCIDRSSWARK